MAAGGRNLLGFLELWGRGLRDTTCGHGVKRGHRRIPDAPTFGIIKGR